MYIPRYATESILEWLHYFPMVGIIGPRQIGKTTLAKKLMSELDKECKYLDMELQQDRVKMDNPELYLEQHLDRCIIIDEIHHVPDLLPVFRGLIDKRRVPGRFLILGSSSPELLKNSSETLAGRIAYKELTPFNLTEIESTGTMEQHWFRGGFPEAFLAPSEKAYKLWLQHFIKTYTERDLRLLGLSASPTQIQKLWTMLAHYHGGIWNASTFANALGVTVPTVNRYVDFLEEAFLIRRIQPFSINIKKRLVKSPKIYIRDSGVLHSLLGVRDFESLQGYVNIGSSWEGYVIEQIIQILPDDLSLYYYRTHAGTESDLVLSRGGRPVSCLEVKYSAAPKISRGFQIAIDDLKTKKNYVIIPRGERYNARKTINVCSLEHFISNDLNRL